MTQDEVIERLKLEAVNAGSQKDLADKFKVSKQYMNDVINGRKDPGDSILKPLGLKRVVTYIEE